MKATTTAAVLVDARKLALRDVPIPEIDAEGGLARVEITGVCGTDWPIYTGELRAFANWHNDRRDVVFRYLRPDIYRHGSRRLRREIAGAFRWSGLTHHFATSSDRSARQV